MYHRNTASNTRQEAENVMESLTEKLFDIER